MRPFEPTEFDENDEPVSSERDLESRPERANRPNASRRVKMRASRRNRTSEVAKRGMHQRRRKRFSW